MERHGGEILVETLINHNITQAYGMPGGQANAYYDALAKYEHKITHTLTRDEITASYAADSYARVSGKIAVCDATVGPGSTRLPSGLMEAYNSSIPVLYIVSDHPQSAVLLQKFGRISQGGDQLNMLKPFAKETFNIPHVDLIPNVISAAIHSAVSARPGPVVVQIPQDVFLDKSTVEAGTGVSYFPKFKPQAEEKEINKAVELLINSKKPAVIVGGGLHISNAY